MILSGRALLPDGSITEAALVLERGVIASVVPEESATADLRVDGTIVPGFIDLQVNGAYGADFTSNATTVTEVARRLPSTGVTAFLPTIITSPLDAYAARLAEIRERSGGSEGAYILGVHLEGPYLNPAKSGAHDTRLVRPIIPSEIVAWADPGIVRVVTLALELPGAIEAIRALRARGIVVSAGHSGASFDQAMAGIAAGVGWATHLFNTMSGLGHREPGLPGALLTSSVPCGLIADGIHVHPAVVALALRAKGPTGINLVTDAMAAMGMAPGTYQLADRDVVVDSVSARLVDGTLAGSILTMDRAVRNAMTFTGCSLADAVTMASTVPARVLGLPNKGRIAPGCDADLVVLDAGQRVRTTFVAGKVVFQADA